MAKTPHFFKIILESAIREGRLRVPKKFARQYGEGMQSQVLLNVPDGAAWLVELRKSDGEIWLQDGWKEFAEHYSLRCGHFVLFRYERNGQFHIVIFDMSASEIEYPGTGKPAANPNFQGQVPGPDKGKTEDDTPDEIPDKVSASKKTTGRPSRPLPVLPEKLRSYSSTNAKRNSTAEIKLENSGCNGNSSLIKEELGDEFKDNIPRNTSSTSEAAKAVSKFVSNNPYFTARVPGSEFRVGYLCIPAAFYKKHMNTSVKVVTLEVSGRLWPVKLNHYPKPSHGRFSAGWPSFFKENNIKVGDICVFELMRKSDALMKVSIFSTAAA